MAGFDPKASFSRAPVARLATATPEGTPHLVPVVFALYSDLNRDLVYTAVDAKPKTTQRLRRLVNIEHNPRVSLLVDHYADDWAQLWWVRVDGIATIYRDGRELQAGYDLLRAKYSQYHVVRLDGPVIAVEARRWSSWHT